VLTGEAAVSHAQLRKTEYYADFARPAGLTRALFGVAGHGGRVHSAVSVNRADDHAEFDEEAVEFLAALLPHFGRALDVSVAWRACPAKQAAALDALDGLPMAVLIVDGQCRVCFANRRASDMLARRDGVSSDAGVLRCADPGANRRLRALCAQIAATRAAVPRHSGGMLAAPRPSSSPDLQILVTPVVMRGPLSVPGRDVAAVLYITDPADTPIPDERRLKATYHLTPAESNVAVLLAAGVTSAEIAERLRYTRETTRWYVKQVLAKAHCRTRSEFVARASHSAAVDAVGRPLHR
jgi:DNA-binding CsgD family transcriptional regulator